MSFPICPKCGSRIVITEKSGSKSTVKACHSCGENFHGGKGGGGGGSSPVKGANILGHFPGEVGGKEKWSDAKGDVYIQRGGANTKLTHPDGATTTVYTKFNKWKTENGGREPEGSGSWSFRIGQNNHTFSGPLPSVIGRASREAANRQELTIDLLP